MRYFKISVLFLLFVLLLGCQKEMFEANMNEKVEDFTFMTANNTSKELSKGDLEGEYWIANFMYTNCQAVCPMMTANLLEVQEELKSEGKEINIVSFTVDPDYDSADILLEHANSYGVDLDHWTFLTGYDFETIQAFAAGSFKVALQQTDPGTGNDQVAHTTNFFLVNPNGKVVKKYEGVGKTGKDQLLADFKQIK